MQKSFSDLEYAAKKKLTLRDRFLAEIDKVTPWSQLHQLIEPFYPKVVGAGRPPVGLARMLRMYVAQGDRFGPAAKARSSGNQNMEQNDWITNGENLYGKRLTAQRDSLNVTCDTSCSVVLWVIDRVINFQGRFELFANPAPTYHHFIVVDRANNSDVDDRTTWGADCFVVDLWHAKLNHSTTSSKRSRGGTCT